ncbi:putative heterokaryon incompatibility protein [Colletotrichum sublineola]|uniref:Putative heterokaryon incompatibility protein n=1 Tax=Colletotrichum sublineola TaxID=1173701 RepID=A0A066XM15_COLSU|nr:putative heterokaryon incompatibility protein [Colletotrichum sublineola]
MRLLNTATLRLSEFDDGQVPPYAILSHTWADQEVLFHDIEDGPSSKAGWDKVQRACRLAHSQDHAWIWIDTCCIDKSSSSELSEAINSMFTWYRDADVCFAYLADVPRAAAEPGTSECASALAASRWFTRGWTLQELLAPAALDFYSSDWCRIGSRPALARVIGSITAIDPSYLNDVDGPLRLARASVAERMSWASRRRTTRAEDLAYCLLGIFDVNMPLIYGEGPTKAFRRLQEAVIRDTDDQSVFAWGDVVEGDAVTAALPDRRPRPLLAESPAAFRNSGDVVPVWNPAPSAAARVRIEHSGVTVVTPLLRETPSKWVASRGRPAVFLAPLLCRRRGDPFNTLALCLRSVTPSDQAYPDAASYYRVSDALLTYAKTAWTGERLRPAFVYFDPARVRHTAGGGGGIGPRSGCAIRTLPRGYRASTAYSRAWGQTDATTVLPLTERLVQSYGLTCPIVVRLERQGQGGGPDGKQGGEEDHNPLALVLQYQHQSLDGDAQGGGGGGGGHRVRFSRGKYWMLGRVVVVPAWCSGVEDVAAVARDEAEAWPAEYVRRISSARRDVNSAGANDADADGADEAFRESRLETFTRFRVGVSQDAGTYGDLLLVDVEDREAPNVSREVRHEGVFEAVGEEG